MVIVWEVISCLAPLSLWGSHWLFKLRIREFGAWKGALHSSTPYCIGVEIEGPEAPNWPQVELVLRQAVSLLLEAYRVINGIWSNYRDSKAPGLFLGPGMRFLRRVEREGGGEVERRWQIVGKSSLARPAPWNAGLHFYTVCLKGSRATVHIWPRRPTYFSSRANSCWFLMPGSKEPAFLFFFAVNTNEDIIKVSIILGRVACSFRGLGTVAEPELNSHRLGWRVESWYTMGRWAYGVFAAVWESVSEPDNRQAPESWIIH